MGGVLVFVGGLTCGQLVSAELSIAAIFAGLPQMAGYLSALFDGCAAIDELSRFKEVRTEAVKKGKFQPIPERNGIEFAKLTDDDSEMSRRKGFIALQDHGKGCQVAFRNIQLKPLKDD